MEGVALVVKISHNSISCARVYLSRSRACVLFVLGLRGEVGTVGLRFRWSGSKGLGDLIQGRRELACNVLRKTDEGRAILMANR